MSGTYYHYVLRRKLNMQRLLYLFRRWLMLFRINHLEKNLHVDVYTPQMLLAFLNLMDVRIFKEVEVPKLRNVTVNVHYNREQLLTILKHAKGAIIYDVHKLEMPKLRPLYIPGELVKTNGLTEYRLSTFLVGDSNTPMKLDELIAEMRHFLFTIAPKLELLDPSEKDYYDRRLRLVWYDVNEILATTLSLVE